jgi:hypothetical protein
VHFFLDQEGARAVVDVARHRIVDATRSGIDSLIILLESAWLPKQLIQRGRQFRSLGLFRGVLGLHHEARSRAVRVALVGGWAMPPMLANAVAEETHRRRQSLGGR